MPLSLHLFAPPARPLTDSLDPVVYGLRKPPGQEVYWQEHKGKSRTPRSSCKVVMRIFEEDCQGVIEDAEGKPLDIVESLQPGMAYHLLWVFCLRERLLPAQSELRIFPGTAKRKKKDAWRARKWFMEKFRRWIRKTA